MHTIKLLPRLALLHNTFRHYLHKNLLCEGYFVPTILHVSDVFISESKGEINFLKDLNSRLRNAVI